MPASPLSRHPARRLARGFSLVELLVAIALGLFIVIALIALYVNVIRSNNEMSKSNQLIENGRFAMQILQDDVALAGFWGPLEQLEATAVPDPCAVYPGSWTAPYIVNMLTVPVQGFQDGTPYAACGGGLAGVVARSDVLFVTRASTCTVGAGCEGAGDTGPHIQLSNCRTEP
ncbi:PilW family protein, partial [Ramlibacter sp.]|uniref:PilW family protein n=1 Tax=Ramlibacter sp. TaxID=1917967 RepID=UPI002FC78D1F